MDQFIVKSDYTVPKIEHESVIELMIEKLSKDSDQTFIIDCTLDRKWTKQQVLDSSLNLAYYISHDLNIKKGDVVCIATNNSDIHAISLIGVLAAGAVYSSFQDDVPEFEINGIITKTKPSLMICTNKNYEIIKKLAITSTFIKKILPIDSQSKSHTNCCELSVEEIFGKTRNSDYKLPIKTGLNDLATFVMTSGSTGEPKVILRTNANQLSIVESLQHKEYSFITPEMTQLTTGLCHISGQVLIIASIYGGSKFAIIREEIDPDYLFTSIHKYGITSAFLAAPRLNYLAKNYHQFNQGSLKSLTMVVTGGAPISENTHNIILKEFDFMKLRNCYGMSEVGWGTQVPVSESRNIANCQTIGKVCPNTEIKVINESGQSLPAHTNGEICIRSTQVTSGYLGNPIEHSKLFTSDGFLRSGDVGYYDDNHYFYIVGRIKDMIIVGSTNVMPPELEGILMTHSDVTNAAVIGVKHHTYNEVPFAFVTLVKGSTVKEQTLIDFVDSRVNYYKKLRGGLKILDTFPLTPLKKINKTELKKMILN